MMLGAVSTIIQEETIAIEESTGEMNEEDGVGTEQEEKIVAMIDTIKDLVKLT